MLKFNINRVFAIRGVTNVAQYLMKNGFTRATAVNLHNYGSRAVKVEYLEKLCRLLNCTPNDFFEWRPREGEAPIEETHALNALRREKTAEINRLMHAIPLEKLTDVEDFLKELKKK